MQYIHSCIDLNGKAGYALASFECAITAISHLPVEKEKGTEELTDSEAALTAA